MAYGGRIVDKDVEGDRISKMIEVIMKVARGDYSLQIEPSGGNDDLDSLAMGLNLSIEPIRALALRLEEKGQAGDLDAADDLIAQLESELMRLRKFLAALE